MMEAVLSGVLTEGVDCPDEMSPEGWTPFAVGVVGEGVTGSPFSSERAIFDNLADASVYVESAK